VADEAARARLGDGEGEIMLEEQLADGFLECHTAIIREAHD
jgi:hypothetical protein